MTPARALVTDEGVEVSGADPDGVHQIGSVTKVCTGLLLALEVVEGALTLETRVGELLPELTGPIGGVTLGQLVTHTSGLPRLPPGMWRKAFGAAARDPYADLDESALLAAVAGTSPRPTSRPRYSNLGFGLLGTALTRHRGTTYGALVRDRVTGPLGMTATDVHVEEHVPGHTRRGRPHRQAWTFDAMAGAGALWSTVTDQVRFLRAQLDPPDGVLGEAVRLSQRPLVERGRTGQAMAWMRVTGRDGTLLWHNGGTAGFRSFVGVDPGRRRAAVVLGSSDRSVDREGFRLVSPR